jgi:GNAT superfamily N-acetyltransferase
MRISPVQSDADSDLFLQVPLIIYKNDSNWIQPLDKDINDVFDKKKNKAFRFGKAERWILKDDNNKLIGRIAAFVNPKYKNKGDDVPVGGIGFFESIDDQAAANLLLDTAKAWLKENGMEAMDGPINFGERDRWWGLVTKGFTEPLYCMNYNPEYYVKLFEDYGFKLFFDQVCFGMKPKDPLEAKIWERHDAIAADPSFSSAHMEKNKLEKYAADFTVAYNKAWAGHGGLKQLSVEQVIIMFKTMKPVMDEKIIWFAYHKNEPIAIYINLPDLNQWFKHLHGKFGLLQKLKFLWVKQFKKNRKFNGIVFGVVPEFQGKGVDAYIIGEAAKYIQSDKCSYEAYEMQWIGDFNPKMLNIASGLGKVHRSRNLTTYRFLFDREKEFKRHPILA